MGLTAHQTKLMLDGAQVSGGSGGGSSLATPVLSAFSGVTSSSITINWGAVANATYYTLEFSLNGSSGWTQIGGNITGTSYSHNTGLSASTTYYYRVTAKNATLTSPTSSVASQATSAAAGGGASSITLAGISLDGSAFLSWRPSGITGTPTYDVQRLVVATGNWVSLATTTNTQYTDPSLSNGDYSTYRIVTGATISPTILIAPEEGSIGESTLAAPTDISAFCVASAKTWLIWKKANYMDRLSWVVEWKQGSGGTWTELVTYDPVVCTRGAYGSDSAYSEKRKVEAQRYHEHVYSSALSGTLFYRIKARYANIIESAYSSEVSVTVQGQYITTTLANLKTQYDNATANTGNAFVIAANEALSTSASITLKRGVSIIVNNGVTATVNYSGQGQYSWDKAWLEYSAGSSSDQLNIEVSGIRLDAGEYVGRCAIATTNAKNFVIRNFTVFRTFWQGIAISGTVGGGTAKNVVLIGCAFTNAGYGPPDEAGDTWADEGNSFIGMTVLRGHTTNVQIFNCTYTTVDSSSGHTTHQRGYGIKALINYIDTNSGNYYNLLDSVMIWSCTFVMGNRLWQGASPQFPIEFWALETILCIVFNCYLENAQSYEHRNSVNMSAKYNIRTICNDVKINYKQSIELSNHKIWVQRNFIDHRSSTGGEECFGDYNKPSSGYVTSFDQIIEENLVYMGNTPIFITDRNIANGRIVRRNTVIWSGDFYAFWNLRTYDDGSAVNIPVNPRVENNAISSGVSGAKYLFRLSTDSNGGGFLNYGNGQATISGTCRVNGNIWNNTVNLPPTNWTNTGNAFGTAPAFAGGTNDLTKSRPAAGGNLVNAGVKDGKAYNGTLPDRGYIEL